MKVKSIVTTSNSKAIKSIIFKYYGDKPDKIFTYPKYEVSARDKTKTDTINLTGDDYIYKIKVRTDRKGQTNGVLFLSVNKLSIPYGIDVKNSASEIKFRAPPGTAIIGIRILNRTTSGVIVHKLASPKVVHAVVNKLSNQTQITTAEFLYKPSNLDPKEHTVLNLDTSKGEKIIRIDSAESNNNDVVFKIYTSLGRVWYSHQFSYKYTSSTKENCHIGQFVDFGNGALEYIWQPNDMEAVPEVAEGGCTTISLFSDTFGWYSKFLGPDLGYLSMKAPKKTQKLFSKTPNLRACTFRAPNLGDKIPGKLLLPACTLDKLYYVQLDGLISSRSFHVQTIKSLKQLKSLQDFGFSFSKVPDLFLYSHFYAMYEATFTKQLHYHECTVLGRVPNLAGFSRGKHEMLFLGLLRHKKKLNSAKSDLFSLLTKFGKQGLAAQCIRSKSFFTDAGGPIFERQIFTNYFSGAERNFWKKYLFDQLRLDLTTVV